MSESPYQRVLLKLSGEVLGNKEKGMSLDGDVIGKLAEDLKVVHELGVEIGVVVGGGNIFRGLAGTRFGIGRVQGDYMGMLATCINALALQDALEHVGVPSRVMTAVRIEAVAEPYIRRRAIRHFEKGRIVIFGGGTGNPYFTTDSAAALRACEIEADMVLKATKVDGIYSADPNKDPEAERYDTISFQEAIDKRLMVMDTAAFALCMENNIPITVFDFYKDGQILRVVKGEDVGTRVTQ